MDILEEGKRLINSDFPLIPLYGIAPNGGCTCHQGLNCKSAGKHPRENDWKNNTINSTEQLEAALKKYPHMNIGIVTGGDFLVVDIDPRHGGMESYEELKEILPETLTVITGSNGLHLYYKKPESVVDISNKTNLYPGIDIRGDGGLVVAPGSKHKSGNYYKFKEYENEK